LRTQAPAAPNDGSVRSDRNHIARLADHQGGQAGQSTVRSTIDKPDNVQSQLPWAGANGVGTVGAGLARSRPPGTQTPQ